MDIRALRKAIGWTQAQLAEKVGTDHVTISRWERGIAVPRAASFRRLGEVFARNRKPQGGATFVVDPTTRLRELDQLRREQMELKRRMRVPGWTR